MKIVRTAVASLFLAAFASSAQADLMYHVAFSDIEGAIMPAVPFPTGTDAIAAGNEKLQAPMSLGLAPNSSAAEQASAPVQSSVEMPVRKRPLSASETSDLFLR